MHDKKSTAVNKASSPKWFHRARLLFDRDEIRIPLQTTAAVLLAFIATLFMSRENMSWGVFSALFVVQVSIGGTVTAGVYRIVGAVLGAVIGVAAVLLPGAGDGATLLRLVVGVITMSVISYRWPQLAYGLVTVAIIIVSPDFYVLEGAMAKILAIGIGSLSGMIAAAAMFPVSAHRRADYHLEQTLHGCGDWLAECMTSLIGKKVEEKHGTIETISYHLSRTREITNYVYTGGMSIGAPLTFPKDILQEIEHFRDTLVLVDRFRERPLSDPMPIEMQKRMQAFAQIACSQVNQLAVAIGARTHCEIDSHLQPTFEQFCDDMASLLESEPLNSKEREHLIAIKLVWGKVYENLTRLCELVNEKVQRT